MIRSVHTCLLQTGRLAEGQVPGVGEQLHGRREQGSGQLHPVEERPEIEIGDRHQGDGGYLTIIEDAAQIRGELAGAHLVLLHEIGRRPEDAELAIGVAGARYDADLYRDPADTAGGAEGISGSGLDDTSRLGRILGE